MHSLKILFFLECGCKGNTFFCNYQIFFRFFQKKQCSLSTFYSTFVTHYTLSRLENLILHNDVAEVPMLAAWVEELGEELGLDMPEVFQLNLALEEAAVNVMNYAYEGEGLIKLSVSSNGQEIVFVMEDEGKEFDPTKVKDPDITLSAEKREIGGLGIFLVQQFMESVAYRRKDGKNVLTMIYKKK